MEASSSLVRAMERLRLLRGEASSEATRSRTTTRAEFVSSTGFIGVSSLRFEVFGGGLTNPAPVHGAVAALAALVRRGGIVRDGLSVAGPAHFEFAAGDHFQFVFRLFDLFGALRTDEEARGRQGGAEGFEDEDQRAVVE